MNPGESEKMFIARQGSALPGLIVLIIFIFLILFSFASCIYCAFDLEPCERCGRIHSRSE